MKTIIRQIHALLFSVCLVITSGCSPSTEHEEYSTDASGGVARAQGKDCLDLSRDFDDFVKSFACGDGTPIRRGEATLEKIVNFPDATCRTNGLAKFRKTMFSIEFSGSDYIKLSNGLGSMKRLQTSYLSAAYRCGCGLEEGMGYRIDFLKWLKREMNRPMGVGTNGIERRLGPYMTRLTVSRERYQKSLADSYKLHLRWMEEAFNSALSHPEYTREATLVRPMVEDYLGRPIRTDEELLRDSGMKK